MRSVDSMRRKISRTARGLGALEAVLLFLLCGAALAVATAQIESMRTTMRTDLAFQHLLLLKEATLIYYLDQGAFPPGRIDLSAGDAWRTLRSVGPSAKVLAGWESVGESAVAGEPLDPWRQPYRYMAPGPEISARVTESGYWPVFASGGPDQHFGSASDAMAEIDNIATDSLVLQENSTTGK